MRRNWHAGNAEEDGRDTRGWLVGHFIDRAHGVRSSEDVEIKWAVHPVDEKRAERTADDRRTTLVLLVRGNFRVDLTETSVIIGGQGDYVLWGPGIDHPWEALSDSGRRDRRLDVFSALTQVRECRTGRPAK
jgi:hypothetical protein